MILALVFAIVLAASPADDAAARAARVAQAMQKAVATSGLVGSAQMTVRVVVVDRCRVSSDGATCEGVAPIRPLPTSRRAEVLF